MKHKNPMGIGIFKQAFTLAEVLITLVIIGVIAAITVPVLMNSYQKQQTAIRLKKAYSELAQAVTLSEVTNGNRETWDYSTLTAYEFFKKYLMPFVKVGEIKMSDYRAEGYDYKYLSGVDAGSVSGVTSMANNAQIITLASGSFIIVNNINISSSEIVERRAITVDINGHAKPNKYGRDVFVFNVSEKGVTPHMQKDGETYKIKRNRTELLTSSSQYACNKQKLGIWCAAVIMADGWEIKDDYPW